MRRDIITSAIAILVLTLLFGIVYPLVVTGLSQLTFPGNANGQKLYVGGKLVGSKIIGQSFEYQVVRNGKPLTTKTKGPLLLPDKRYFQTRPSATGEPYVAGGTPDNAAGSSFANYGPNSKITLAALEGNITTYLGLNCNGTLSSAGTCSSWYDPNVTSAAQLPVDAADTSASGIDPDISQANADIQAYRIAAVRHLSLSRVDGLISTYTHGRGLGFSGEPGVNVLQLNIALDRIAGGH